MRCVRPERFSQLAVASVIPDPAADPDQFRDGTSAYGPDLTDIEPKFSPDTLEERRGLLAEESDRVRDFMFADAPGYAVVHVSGTGVTADLYAGLGKRRWRTVKLA